MSKWLEDLLLNIEIWLYRRLRKLLQHGDATFAGIDTLHAHLDEKEQYRDGVYLHLRERLEGTDEHPLAEGVPVRPLPAVQDLEHLQEAVELLDTRKIEDASPDIPDGVSLVRLLCDSSLASQVTEIIDTNSGYVMDKALSLFPNVIRLILGCEDASVDIGTNNLSYLSCPNLKRIDGDGIIYCPNCTEQEPASFPELEYYHCGGYSQQKYAYIPYFSMPKLKTIYFYQQIGTHAWFADCRMPVVSFPMLELIQSDAWNNVSLISSNSFVEEIYMPNLITVKIGNMQKGIIFNCQNLIKLDMSSFVGYNNGSSSLAYNFLADCPKLIDLRLSLEGSFNLSNWSPTMSLRTDTTASDYIDLREDKDDSGEFINATNLEQFLANFRKYIIIRLANRTGLTALTLTLSAAVYQAIYGLDSSNNADNSSWARTHTLADLGLTADDLTEAETAAGITINTIYATWLDTYRSAINWNIGH